MDDDIERLIATFQAGLHGKPDRALHLIGLAELVWKRKNPIRAFELARQALAAGQGDPRVTARGRALLHRLLPNYHVPMMNDARRNAAWDKALRAAIRPGMHVFEIGTGAGMLAMMAARAGAAHVTTCESDEVAAMLAREIIAHNGFADRVTVLTARSQNVVLERRADLLFCDIFGDSLFDFDPLALIADARMRLLVPGAAVVPATVELRAALGTWSGYDNAARLEEAAGFDLTPMRDVVVAAKTLKIWDPGLRLMSRDGALFGFELARDPLWPRGTAGIAPAATEDGEANGIVRWIKLELDADTVLEARPEPGATFFSGPVFCPLPRPRRIRKGEAFVIRAAYEGRRLETWLEG